MRAHCARCAIAAAHRSDRAIVEEFSSLTWHSGCALSSA